MLISSSAFNSVTSWHHHVTHVAQPVPILNVEVKLTWSWKRDRARSGVCVLTNQSRLCIQTWKWAKKCLLFKVNLHRCDVISLKLGRLLQPVFFSMVTLWSEETSLKTPLLLHAWTNSWRRFEYLYWIKLKHMYCAFTWPAKTMFHKVFYSDKVCKDSNMSRTHLRN